MREKLINWSPVILLLLLAGLTWWLDAKIRNQLDANTPNTSSYPDFYVIGYQATRMNQLGEKLYSLEGNKLEHYALQKLSSLSLPVLMYYSGLDGPISFASEKARLINNGEHVYFEGNVEINRPKNDSQRELTIKTSHIHIIPDEETAVTDKEIFLNIGNSKLSAVGLEFNNKTRIINLLSQVQANYENPYTRP